LRDRIQRRHAPTCISGEDAVTNGVQRDRDVLFAAPERILCGTPFSDISRRRIHVPTSVLRDSIPGQPPPAVVLASAPRKEAFRLAALDDASEFVGSGSTIVRMNELEE